MGVALVAGREFTVSDTAEAPPVVIVNQASRFMSALVFGVTTTDATTFAGLASFLLAVAFLACYLPARRATRVDPLVAPRSQ